MDSILIWTYIINSAIIIAHEVDSAYQREWELFRIPGGPGLFVLAHIPLATIIFYGLLGIYAGDVVGLYISLALAISGMLGFLLHASFLARGDKRFTSPYSIAIIIMMLLFSFVQALLSAGKLLA